MNLQPMRVATYEAAAANEKRAYQRMADAREAVERARHTLSFLEKIETSATLDWDEADKQAATAYNAMVTGPANDRELAELTD